jgi:hypothetical protein
VRERRRTALHHGAGVITGGGVHDDAGRLADRGEVVVLEEDGHVGRLGLVVPGGAPEEDELLGPDAVIGAEGPGLVGIRAALEDGLGAGAAGAAELRLDEAIEAHAGALGRDAQDAHDGALGDLGRADDGRPAAERALGAFENAGADPRHGRGGV